MAVKQLLDVIDKRATVEILFKAKRVKNGEWIEGSLIDLDIDSGYCYIVPPYKQASTLPIGFLITDGMELVIPETLCQFTGLCGGM